MGRRYPSTSSEGCKLLSKPLTKILICGPLLLGPALPAWGQETTPTPEKRHHRSWMDLTDRDTFVPVTSVEWGTPDRWSVTTRYIHFFEKERDNKTWLNEFTVTLSPGTGGGRLGIGYQGIFLPDLASKPDWAMFIEARGVLLRTWGNPLETEANRTFAGAEIRFSPAFFCNIGVGYYWQISAFDGPRDAFWGYHVGIGI